MSRHDRPGRASGGRPERIRPAGYVRTPAGEPPILLDPRRWGALVGIVGGLVFVVSYAPPLGLAVSLAATLSGAALASVALLRLYVRPSSLGLLREPSRAALLVYACCVVGELAAIAAGSRLLTDRGHADLRPALVAAVVGLHFLPFAWAFGESTFYRLGLALVVLGGAGLVTGYAGVARSAEAAAVLSGLGMLALILRFGTGLRRSPSAEARSPTASPHSGG